MSPGALKGEDALMSVSMESCEGEGALGGEGESSRDSELPRTFMHSITVVPVALPVGGEAQLWFSLPLGGLDLQTGGSVGSPPARLSNAGFGRAGAGQEEVGLEVREVVPGDVQALGPPAPVEAGPVVAPPLGLPQVLHEGDAPHGGRRLALGLLQRDGARAEAQAAVGAVVRRRDGDGVAGAGAVLRAASRVQEGVVLSQPHEVMVLLSVTLPSPDPPSVKQKVPGSVGVERERSRNLKAFAAALDRADLSRPLPSSPNPPPPPPLPPSAAAPSVSLRFPIIAAFPPLPEALLTDVKELECELADCPELTSITPSGVPPPPPPPPCPMTLCCLGGTAGPLLAL
ncbi:hypothetical protein EYF80_043227 [Liparis tanakae]|uniref:Uncharacterized protein n=1 Tax=Liparis tanakae TaxID=230148 RepID=A0A4Z2G0X5_9TELE|nr:hypothetical protein EYF80_043227 [Liparis tanakae]